MGATARETRERELKLDADEGFVLPDVGGRSVEERVFTSTYHDTPGRRLARYGITLRRRVENGLSLWQLKLPDGAARLELEVAGGPAPPQELRDLLAGLVRTDPLESVATLRTRRAGVLVSDRESGFAEVVLDEVAVLDGPRVAQRFREVEVELLDGDEALLERLGRTLRRAGARRGDGQPKLFRVLGLALNGAPAFPDATLRELALEIARQVEAILVHDPGVRLGRDPEQLHGLRVAMRRLRAILRAAAPFVEPEWARELRAELAWLGHALGPARDDDVMLAHLRGAAAELDERDRTAFEPLLERLERERLERRRELLAALSSERYLALLGTLEQAAAHPRLRPAETRLRELAAAEFGRLRREVRALGAHPADPALHALRIRGKRARYAAELAAREGDRAKATAAFVREAKAFQDAIGDHQDAIVAEERLRTLAAAARGGTALAAGRLVERQRRRRAEARGAWPAVWKRLERAGERAFL